MTNINNLFRNIEAEVEIQDQTSGVIDLFVTDPQGETTLAEAASFGDLTFEVEDATGFEADQCLCVSLPGTGLLSGHVYQGLVVSVDGTTVTANVPLDRDFPAGTSITSGIRSLAIDASSEQKVYISGPPAGTRWDICGINISITDGSAMNDGLFGGISALSNGVLFRKQDGKFSDNIFWAKTNSDLRLHCYDVIYDENLFGTGTSGLGCRRRLNGQENNGVAIRLDGDRGEMFQVVLNDDLTGLLSFTVVVQGHVVVD